MKTPLKAALLLGLGAMLGFGASFALREATRTPLPEREVLAPAPPPPLPPSPEPDPPPPSPPPRPAPEPQPEHEPPPSPRIDFLGFDAGTKDRAPESVVQNPPPAPEAPKPPLPLVHDLLEDRCVAGFDGNSTLHAFRGWTKSVGGEIRFEKGRLETASASIVVDARTLDTGNPDRDQIMHEEHLHTAKHPEFRFTLREFKPGAAGAFRAKGTLEIHGVAREIELPGRLARHAGGYLHAKGELPLKMSDFGVVPPSKVLVIRVDDQIKVWFEIWARERKEKP